MDKEGNFTGIYEEGTYLSGKTLLDYCDRMSRSAYITKEQSALDFMWYLWCCPFSPIFGKHRMTTFERYFIEDKATWTEHKDPYYSLTNKEEICDRILQEFNLDPAVSHIINGHMPVKLKKGESPVRANGKLLIIDGGFARAYQPETASRRHNPDFQFLRAEAIDPSALRVHQKAIEEESDIHSDTQVVKTMPSASRSWIPTTAAELSRRWNDLKLLVYAYREGPDQGTEQIAWADPEKRARAL
jgi:fructose-1,6-bisphosphatase-3